MKMSKIMIVDDDPNIRELVSALLQTMVLKPVKRQMGAMLYKK